MQVEGEPSALLQWYQEVDETEDEYTPTRIHDREKLNCLGKATVREGPLWATDSEGEEVEYVVIDVASINEALKKDITEEQMEEQDKELRSLVGGTFYNDNRRSRACSSHKRCKPHDNDSNKRQKTTVGVNKENEVPQGTKRRRSNNTGIQDCQCTSSFQAVNTLINSNMTLQERLERAARR